jgi:hypothetical protein
MAERAINASASAVNEATSFMDADQGLLTRGMTDAAEVARACFEGRPDRFKGD